ncbi:two-component system phosphate regulon sensor histidine kinase PhoR [Parabacteroides sp. PFB2-10]|uniref:sensor histidine kinase n=1 Tax=Parabacteroides sp. PFB2-10 TaxID=1742405 RepID=UPI002474EBDA|nr:HAMP domain-containing sensor histidine kinase [Parabacteroides sp. PFB2-10]MDH6313085.1 two-component system phosphate regulon sensor histidine kinase PhoR [Parabacteroides sp. PFB2-10]
MRGKHFRVIALLGMFTIISLQSIWLVNTYSLIKNEFSITATNLLEKALDEETFVRLNILPKGTQVPGKPVGYIDSIPAYVYFNEELSVLGANLSMEKLYEIYKDILLQSGVKTDFFIYKYDADNESVYELVGNKFSSFFVVKTLPLPILINQDLFIQAEFNNPKELYFNRMGILLISTAILMAFVIWCIVYQISIIFKQNKIAQVREDFSYAMIHDMKTPLSSIMMCANFLHSGRLDDKPDLKEKYFKIINNEAEHLLLLTNKVLTISKLESNKLEMKLSQIELAPLFEDLINNFTAKSVKSVHFLLDLKANTIYADEEFIKEVFNNLIDNSIKYSNESVTIKISSENVESYSVVKIFDNGIGISEKDQKVIFNKFERASAVKRVKKGGASGFGLGLNYTSQVMEAHQGRILVNSIEGEFTEFILYIPLLIKKI